jgi:hypothetical protein
MGFQREKRKKTTFDLDQNAAPDPGTLKMKIQCGSRSETL